MTDENKKIASDLKDMVDLHMRYSVRHNLVSEDRVKEMSWEDKFSFFMKAQKEEIL